MIKKMSDYDQTSAFGQSEFKPLPKGGYICRVIKAEETQSSTGKPMLHIAFDIIEGDYTGYFMNLFQTRKKNNDDPLKEIKYPFTVCDFPVLNPFKKICQPGQMICSFFHIIMRTIDPFYFFIGSPIRNLSHTGNIVRKG